MIFNGTANRPAAGMAEVSLLFDNKNGILPVPYREVLVSRRIYRSGDSEYLINKTKCRLKDVTDLFWIRELAPCLPDGAGAGGYDRQRQTGGTAPDY